MAQTAARLAELEIAELPFQDPSQPVPPSLWRRLTKYGVVLAALVALWLVDWATNLGTSLLADTVGQQLPYAVLGWVALLAATSLGLALLAAGLREQGEH
jgi:hypothetical protein